MEVGEEPETPQGHQRKQVQGGQLPHFTREPQAGLTGTHPGTRCGGRKAEVGGVGGRRGTPHTERVPCTHSALCLSCTFLWALQT